MQKINIDELLKKSDEEILSYFKQDNTNLLIELLNITLENSFCDIMEHLCNCIKKKEITKNDKIIYPCVKIAGTVAVLINLFNYTKKEQNEIFKNKITIEDTVLHKKIFATASITKSIFEEIDDVISKIKKHIDDGTDLKKVNLDFIGSIGLLHAYLNMIIDIFDISDEELNNSYNCKKDLLFKKFGRDSK